MNSQGYWQMHCWNGLSQAQQTRLIERGNLEIGSRPEALGGCPNPADCAIETRDDKAPGPRFYCYSCAAEWLMQQNEPKLSVAEIRKIKAEAEFKFHQAIKQARQEYGRTLQSFIAEPQRIMQTKEQE